MMCMVRSLHLYYCVVRKTKSRLSSDHVLCCIARNLCSAISHIARVLTDGTMRPPRDLIARNWFHGSLFISPFSACKQDLNRFVIQLAETTQMVHPHHKLTAHWLLFHLSGEEESAVAALWQVEVSGLAGAERSADCDDWIQRLPKTVGTASPPRRLQSPNIKMQSLVKCRLQILCPSFGCQFGRPMFSSHWRRRFSSVRG